MFLLQPLLGCAQSGDLGCSFEDLFDSIMSKITHVIADECPNTELIMIPSQRDVTHDKVYPQPPLQLSESNPHKDHERIHTFSNPATITIKEMTIGVTTTDILFDLGKRETAEGMSGDRMGRLANHLLEQRSFYPLVPPAAGVNMEYEQIEKIALPLTPDIMLLPSDLKHFVKNINGALLVNPGTCTPLSHLCHTIFPIFLPLFRLYEVVSRHRCVLPYKYPYAQGRDLSCPYSNILERLPKLMEVYELMESRPPAFNHISYYYAVVSH